jgi:hypothetical protein
MNSMNTIKPPKVSALQKHIDGIKKIIKKEVEKELSKGFEASVQLRVKEYISKHMPELEKKRDDLSKKIEQYDKMTNKFKPIFTQDEFKSVLMCIHPDGERSKEKLEEVFKLFKSKEIQLTGGKK